MSFFNHRWVRGEHFWGRQEIISTLHKRLDKFTWILGNRRVGKTSLLRQIEYLCNRDKWGYTPLYLDFQGAGDDEGLKMAFLEAFDEQEGCVEALGLDLDDLENRSLSSFLFQIKRNLKRSDLNILFLIDEAEELVDISHSHPQVLSILRKFFHDHDKIGVFLTSSYVLHEVKEPSRTSQFIQEFLPPVRLFPFTKTEAIQFLQEKGLTQEDSQQIYQTSLGNPYLIQNLGEKTLEKGFQSAYDELLNSKFFRYFFESNFNCLPLSLREGLKQQPPDQFFRGLDPAAEVKDYLVQSSIYWDRGKSIEPNPLLEAVYRQSQTIKAPEEPKRFQAFFDFSNALLNRSSQLSALQVDDDWPDPVMVRQAQEPPSMEMLRLSDEKTLLHTLLWATPEFINGKPPSEHSNVYLAGIFLATSIFGQNPLEKYCSVKDRLQAYADCPVQVDRAALNKYKIQPKLGMILLKSLASDSEMRYHSLRQFIADVKQTQDG